MFTKEFTYPNFAGEMITEKFRFNLSEYEMMDIVREDPNFDVNWLAILAKEAEPIKMIDIIRKLLVLSYGELSEDGKHFRKNDQIATDFVCSAAYNAILDEFLTSGDTNLLTDFMYGIFPAKFQSQLKTEVENAKRNGTIVPVN